MTLQKKIAAISIIVLLFFSCRKDFERPNWDIDLLTPLIKTTLTIEDLFTDSIVQTNPDTSLKLVFQTEIFNIEMDSLFQIPDTTITETYSFLFSSLASPGASFYSNDEEKTFNINNGVELNLIQVESGFIEIEVFSEIKEKIIVTYTIPGATRNGDTLILNDIVPAATISQDGYLKKIIDLSGYDLDLTGISKSEVNTLVTRAEGVLDTNAAGPVVISGGSKITYKNKFVDVVPFFVRGYFGTQQLHFGPETTTTSAFSAITGGTLDLEQVDVNLEFKNGIGVDAQLILNQFSTTNTNTGMNNLLIHSSIGTSLNLNRAQLTNTIPEVIYSSYNLDMNTVNSNIDQLTEIFPTKFHMT
ncbi:MAG: hypothetical protein JKY30_00095 [Flavobacteriales bacterium]|nr:hypothetical protein [Flavobacteriales bacterium]